MNQTAGAAVNAVDAPPAGYAQRSPDNGVVSARVMMTSACCLCLLAGSALTEPPENRGPRVGACQAAAVEIFGRKPPALGKDVPEPKKTRHVRVAFPQRELPPGGKNVFSWFGELLIDPAGDVRRVFVIRDFSFEPPWPEFSAAVPKAMRQWRYTPTSVGGVAVPVCMQVSVNVRW